MGRKRGGIRRNKRKLVTTGIRGNYDIVKHDKDNASFVGYYQKQQLIPIDEWDQFMAALRRDLPTSFRFVGCKREADVLRQVFERRFVDELKQITEHETDVEVPTPIPWYPNRLGFQMIMPRSIVRKHTILNQMHNFLVTECELGNLSRQEVVSMIPPLLLDVRPEHKVLDVCAAPGSKTTQIIEMLHSDGAIPDGFVVANDVDNSRCYLLVHQALKRMPTPCCIVINHDAQSLPNMYLETSGERLRFDRILCDVICSGDGTFRKNPDIWKKWTPQQALALHKLQFNIAKRSVELLADNGLMVYSTCSLNPIEDEAVVARLLQLFNGTLELVDVSNQLPELLRSPGVSTWKVMDKDLNCFESIDKVPESMRSIIVPSMFPPTDEEAKRYHLERTFRIFPHMQNTGGFYVALLKKVGGSVTTESSHSSSRSTSSVAPPMKRKRNSVYKEDPFVFLQPNDRRWLDLARHYGIDDDTFPYQQLLARTFDANNKGSLYFVNRSIKQLLETNTTGNIKVINAGLRMFGRVEVRDNDATCPFRLAQEGISIFYPYMGRRTISVDADDMHKLLANLCANKGNCLINSLKSAKQLAQMDSGSLAMHCRTTDGNDIVICVWLGKLSLTPYISKEQRIHVVRMLGFDTTELGKYDIFLYLITLLGHITEYTIDKQIKVTRVAIIKYDDVYFRSRDVIKTKR